MVEARNGKKTSLVTIRIIKKKDLIGKKSSLCWY